MGQKNVEHDYMPKTYEPIVPQKPTLAVPPAFQSPPKIIVTPEKPAVQPQIPSAPQGGNGMPYCSGPQSPGYNVSTGKCENNPIHAIVPTSTKSSSTSTVLQLDQLPYTGDSFMDTEMSAAFYVLIVGVGFSGISLILNHLQKQRV